MEILRSNFKEKFDLIKSSIDEATFLAIDCEFTGLNEEWNLRAYDTPTERYEKIKEGAMKFLVIQFGLCAFKYNKTNDKYTHKAFNFYIFPRSFGRQSPDPRFYSQASSLEFLAEQGFDFNKLLREGIPFLTSNDEDILTEKLTTRHTEDCEKYGSDPIPKAKRNGSTETVMDKVPKEHEKFIKGIHAKISNFLSKWKEGETITLPACTAYQRKLIYETARVAFNNDNTNLCMETVSMENGDKFIKVSKQSSEDANAKMKERHAKEVDELDEALGFTKVIRAISKSDKLVIGHNMLLDVMHLVHQFCTPLPDTYEEFKILGHCIFPKLLDTKVMASTNPFKEHFTNTALINLLKRTREKPFKDVLVAPEANFDGCYESKTEQLHEAGYDAYITGLCYLSLANYLGNHLKSDKKSKHIFPDNPIIKAFTNKLFMMLSPDIPYLNFGGSDLEPNRRHVFYVTFPKEWKTSDLLQLFSPCGNSFVSWIDDKSAFVSLKNPNHAENAKSLVTNDICGQVQVMTYDDYCKKKPVSKRKIIDKPKVSPIECSTNEKKRKCATDDTANENVDLGEAVQRSEIQENESPKKPKKLFEEVASWN